MDETFSYSLIGGPLDGTTDKMESEDGMYDHLTFVHPELPGRSVHYAFEGMYEDGSMEYGFRNEFSSDKLEEYAEEHMKPIEDWSEEELKGMFGA